MKNTIISIIVLALAATMHSCGSSTSSDPLVGQWQATSTSAMTTLVDKYIEFEGNDIGSSFSKVNDIFRQFSFVYVHNTDTGDLVLTYEYTLTVAARVEFLNNDAISIETTGDKVYYVRKSISQAVRDEAIYGKVTGEWKISKMGQSSTDIDVYLEFLDNGTCNVFQSFSSSSISVYPGTYTYVKGVLSGSYTDGASWMSDYTVSFDDQYQNMTLVNSTETNTYTRTEIPSYIRQGAVTKSVVTAVPFL